MGKFRQQKIDEEIKRELSSIIPNLKDPRINETMISVVSVVVTKDLKYAKAFVSIWGADDKKQEVLKALNLSAGFIRREVSKRIQLRFTPEITFVSDNSIEYGAHINKVLRDLGVSKEEKDD